MGRLGSGLRTYPDMPCPMHGLDPTHSGAGWASADPYLKDNL